MHLRSLLAASTLACAAPPGERPVAPPRDPEAELHAARVHELDGLRCAELVEHSTTLLPPRGVEKLAGLLLQRCTDPEPRDDEPPDPEPQLLRERAADRIFRELPSQLPAYQDGVYELLADPRAVALAKRLFPHFLAHASGRAGKDGAQPLAEWAPHAALYRRLALTCDDLRALAPDTGAALELWLKLRADARCPDDAAAAYRSALAGTTSGRAVACERLRDATRPVLGALVPESELLAAALSDAGEHEYRPTRQIDLGELVIPIRYEPSSSRYPGRDACLRALATRHAVLVTRVVVDSPIVTMTVAYVGRPRAVVVFTADRDGAPTPGWVVSSDPQVPPELAALVAGSWPKKQLKPETMSIHPLTDRSIVPGGLRFGAPEPHDGPHFWEIVLRRHPRPRKFAVLVLDEDGTIRRATDR